MIFTSMPLSAPADRARARRRRQDLTYRLQQSSRRRARRRSGEGGSLPDSHSIGGITEVSSY